jgi:Domain of unknown function (DUF397)
MSLIRRWCSRHPGALWAQSSQAPWRSSWDCDAGLCVEVAQLPNGVIGVRDTGGIVISYRPGEWRAFLDGVRNGEFDGLYGWQGC